MRFSGTAGDVWAALDTTVALLRRDELRIPVTRAYSLAEAAQAHADSQAAHTRGRRVLLVGEGSAG